VGVAVFQLSDEVAPLTENFWRVLHKHSHVAAIRVAAGDHCVIAIDSETQSGKPMPGIQTMEIYINKTEIRDETPKVEFKSLLNKAGKVIGYVTSICSIGRR
jgi:hypothetical protein